MNEIEKYYNKFNEDKRLTHRHGIVEYTISMKYIQKYILKTPSKIIDIGAGTGRYSVALSDLGHDVTAVELVKHNLNVIKEKSKKVNAILGNALNLQKFADNTFDIAILFGPMYHLFTYEDKLKALKEAKRVTKTGGFIFVGYVMNEYAFIKHAIIDGNLRKALNENKLDKNYQILSTEKDLYSYSRLYEIDKLKDALNLKREVIFAPDGATDYIRKYINALSEDDFKEYIKYQETICEFPELLGASSHVVDVLQK